MQLTVQTSMTPRPVLFRRYCSLCAIDIKQLFVVGRDPQYMTPAEKRAYFSAIGNHTSLDSAHVHPLCSACSEAIAPYLANVKQLENRSVSIERRHYHGRVRHGQIRFSLAIDGKSKRCNEGLVKAFAYWLLTTHGYVWADGVWYYGQGYTRESLKPRKEAQCLGMNAETELQAA